MKRFLAAFAALILPFADPAAAGAVTDCPLRDAPFSADSPLVDLLLSPAARAILSEAAPGRFDKLPKMIAGTEPPTFAAILTLHEASMFTGLSPDVVTGLDAKLRALPVTDADRTARCARYDNDRPSFALPAGRPRLLLFEKINGFRDGPSVDAAHAAFVAMAQRKGWAIVSTDKGGAITPASLKRFDAVIWNNISGDVLTLSQRKALKDYVLGGGGFVAVHGSGGDPAYFWDWYADTLIGARFKAHPMSPQFQDATVKVEQPAHPIAKGLPAEWTMKDEWYSFKSDPRASGAQVVLTLDEASYKPVGPMGVDLRMGYHPIAWTHCLGRGRSFYSAIGHRPEIYSEPHNVALLEAAITWATDKASCPVPGR